MQIRAFKSEDAPQILALSSRFNEIDFLAYRDLDVMTQKQLELAQKSIASNASNIFVAESNGHFLGYLEMSSKKDYFTQKEVAYIEAIAVLSTAEKQGVGQLLMTKAEDWCREQHCTELVLDVFSANQKAISFYGRLGFDKEIIKMVKSVTPKS